MSRLDAVEESIAWGEDTIYCEATCAPEDVLYEGSDDEDYDSPISRQLRYEAAGQKFLDGQTPFVLTATLQGPFNAASAWVNPWRSKHRTSGGLKGERRSPTKLPKHIQQQRQASIPETQLGQHDSLECHLPSPESIKHAPIIAAHPFLEDEELSVVQKWRSSVPNVAKDGFWGTTPTGSRSDRKRKAKGSEWLRKIASKRQRTDMMDSYSADTPIQKQSGPSNRNDETCNTVSLSFSSLPDRLPSSITTTRTLRRHDSSRHVQRRPCDEEEDELNDSLSASFSSAPTRTGSPGKRMSPRKNLTTRAIYETARDSDDELSRDEIAAIKAAATLSSPVSQNQFSQPLPRKSPRHILSQRVLEQQSPSRRSVLQNPLKELRDCAGEGCARDENFATQRDGSFCYKRAKADDKDENEDQLMPMENEPSPTNAESWSGLSSSEEESASEADDGQDVPAEMTNLSNPEDGVEATIDANKVEADDNKSSSELSSVASEEIEGLHAITADDVDIHMASDSVASGSSDTASETCDEPESSEIDHISTAISAMEPPVETTMPSENSQDETGEDCPMEEDRDSPTAQLLEEESFQHNSIANDAAESVSQDKSDDKSSTSSESPTPEDSELEPCQPALVETTSPLPNHLGLLKCSVKRFVPKSSWAKLSQSTGGMSSSPTRVATSSPSTNFKIGKSPTASLKPAVQLPSLETLLAEPKSVETPQPSKVTVLDTTDSSPKSSHRISPCQPPQDQQTLLQDGAVGSAGEKSVLASQQSPWAGGQLSQFATLAMKNFVGAEAILSSPEKMDASPSASSDAHTPRTDTPAQPPMAPKQDAQINDNEDPPSASHTVDTTCSISSQVQVEVEVQNKASSTPVMAPPRPSTPEPQFSFKSMASFMSPSPERRPRSNRRAAWLDSGSRLPSTQGIIASATKNPWGGDVSQRRVSWAPLPHEMSSPAAASEVPSPMETRSRHASPPPTTPIAELPTSEDVKFHDHFSAVARRSGGSSGLRHHLLPTASQRSLGSPAPQAMAETFLAADQLQKPSVPTVDTSDDAAGMDRPGQPSQESQEPMDIVEDVMREMGDYLGTWDVDMELDMARKGGGMQTPQLTQSPW